MEKKVYTLLIVLKDGKILLGMKKRGFGQGRYDGFGGKPEQGESLEDAALRELEEEAGIVAKKLEKRGTLHFIYNHTSKVMESHLFSVTEFTGEPKETEEMRPEWFSFDAIPYDQAWPDDPFLASRNYCRAQCGSAF